MSNVKCQTLFSSHTMFATCAYSQVKIRHRDHSLQAMLPMSWHNISIALKHHSLVLLSDGHLSWPKTTPDTETASHLEPHHPPNHPTFSHVLKWFLNLTFHIFAKQLWVHEELLALSQSPTRWLSQASLGTHGPGTWLSQLQLKFVNIRQMDCTLSCEDNWV